jgi:hypothetical protein
VTGRRAGSGRFRAGDLEQLAEVSDRLVSPRAAALPWRGASDGQRIGTEVPILVRKMLVIHCPTKFFAISAARVPRTCRVRLPHVPVE